MSLKSNFVDLGEVLCKSAHTRLPLPMAERIRELARIRGQKQAQVLRDILCERLGTPKAKEYRCTNTKIQINAALERRAKAWRVSKPNAMLRILDQYFKTSTVPNTAKKNTEQGTRVTYSFNGLHVRLDVKSAVIINRLAQERGHPKDRVLRDTLCDALHISRPLGQVRRDGQQHGTEYTQSLTILALDQKANEWNLNVQGTIRRVIKEYLNSVEIIEDNNILKYYREYLNGVNALELSKIGLNEADVAFVIRFHKEISSGAGLVRLSVSNPRKPISLLKQLFSEWQQGTCEMIM